MKLTQNAVTALHQAMQVYLEGEHYHDHLGDSLRALFDALGQKHHAVTRCDGCREWAYSNAGLCMRCEPEDA